MNKDEIKSCIEDFINRHMLTQASLLIEEYKKLFGNEENIISMEAIVNLYEGNYDETLKCIRSGLKLNIFNSDLYYTMGNVYELKSEYDRAYLCYKQAEFLCDIEENRETIKDSINALVNNHDIKVRKTSIVILTYNNLEYTQVCLNSIKKYNRKDSYEIIIVDNNSTDGTREWLKAQDWFKIILNNENKGFPAGCNQGIKASDNADDIFLLNNDTVIMPNSIFNMRMALYSKEDIGATGAISNKVSNHQQVDIEYDDFDDYIKFAMENNVIDEASYEERLKLIGFAMLIKREALNKVGLLDERFTPGNFEDDDLSLRLICTDYKLLLCKDSYIHHFGSISFKKDIKKYLNLAKVNEEKFSDKWKFDIREATNIYFHCEKYLSNEQNIIDITCGLGGTLLNIKQKFKNMNVYGYDKNKNLENIISKSCIKLNKDEFVDYSNYFDAVIISDFVEILESVDILDDAKDLLNDSSGNLIIVIDEYRYHNINIDDDIINKVINKISSKLFSLVDRQVFTGKDDKVVQQYMSFRKISIEEFITQINLLIEDGKLEEAKEKIEIFKSLDIKTNIENIKLKLDEKKKIFIDIKFLLRRWEFNIGLVSDEDMAKVILGKNVKDKDIIKIVEDSIVNKVLVLNKIAIVFFSMGRNESVLPYLEIAYNINPEDNDTLYNLSYVLNSFGEKNIALEYIEKIKDKNDIILDLIDIIKGV